MDDQRDDYKVETPRRLEILTGGGQRQRWPVALRARIVAESLAHGTNVAALARRCGARASQIHTWRRDAREGRLALPEEAMQAFAQVVIAPPGAARSRPPSRRYDAPMLEIEAGRVIVRVREGADASLVEAVLRALKARS